MPARNRDLPLSGAVDSDVGSHAPKVFHQAERIQNPDVINWKPLYDTSEKKPHGIDAKSAHSSPRRSTSPKVKSIVVSNLESRSSSKLTPPSKRKPSESQIFTPQNISRVSRRDSSLQIHPVATPECTSSLALAPSRPSSRLPRPVLATTPIRKPSLQTQLHSRPRPLLNHTLRQSLTMNDITSVQYNFQTSIPEEDEDVDEEMKEGEDLTITSPREKTRLPILMVESPKNGSEMKVKERRFVSTPVLPSQKKENVIPVRLLRPVSPTQAQSCVHAQAQSLQPIVNQQSSTNRLMPRSRTVGVLSNLRSTFRRSRSSLNLDLTSRKSSASSTSTVEVTVVETEDIATTFSVYAFGPQKPNYWVGRLSSTMDQIHNEALEACLASAREGASPTQHSDPRDPSFTVVQEDADFKNAFDCLGSMCKDEEAKKSLYLFQLQYARLKGKPDLLPEGGKMEPLLERLGRKVEGAWSRRMSSRLG